MSDQKTNTEVIVHHYKLKPSQSTRYLTDEELNARLQWNMKAVEDLESAEII